VAATPGAIRQPKELTLDGRARRSFRQMSRWVKARV